MTSNISACQSIKNKGINPALEAQSSSLAISFQFSICSTCLSWFFFVYVHMNRLGYGILIPFSRSVAMFRIVRLLFITAFDSRIPISIALHCASAITCTYVDCCTSTCTFVDICIFASMMFSSPMFFYAIYASQLCISLILQ